MTVYFVDDDPLELELWNITINNSNYNWNVFTFTKAADMMAQMPQIVPDVIVVDYVMPFMPGTEVCKWLHENYPQVRVFVNTSLEGEEYEILAKLCNAIFMSKKKSFEERVGVIANGYES